MGSNINITLFAGISGIDKKSVVGEIIRRSGRRDGILDLDFEEILVGQPSVDSPDISTFLDTPSLRAKIDGLNSCFRRVTDEIQRAVGIDDVFLRMHLSYFKNSEVFPPMLPNLFSSMLAQIPGARLTVVTLLDDVFTVWQKLRARAEGIYSGTDLRLREIMIWRSLEALRAESIRLHLEGLPEAHAHPMRNYLASVRHPYGTFESLAFERNPGRVYLSYPITSTRGSAEARAEINDFRRDMYTLGRRARAAVFDPVAIDELAIREAYNAAGGDGCEEVRIDRQHRWPLDTDDAVAEEPRWPITIPAQEVREVPGSPKSGRTIPGDIENQIRSRDYRLVETARIVAAYRPQYMGKKSEGVSAEIRHANETSRRVVVYHPVADDLPDVSTHPFGTNATILSDRGEFMDCIGRWLEPGAASLRPGTPRQQENWGGAAKSC